MHLQVNTLSINTNNAIVKSKYIQAQNILYLWDILYHSISHNYKLYHNITLNVYGIGLNCYTTNENKTLSFTTYNSLIASRPIEFVY